MRWCCLFFLTITFGCQQFSGSQLRLELSAPQQAVLFVVKNDKTVLYGGGINAVEGKTSWQGEMDAKQQQEYESLLRLAGWLHVTPESDKNMGTGQYKIRVRTENIDVKFKLALNNKEATSLYNFLLRVADSRLNQHLRGLPKPDVDVIIDRKSIQE